ncbi:hypothetical protein BX666DRAFT_2009923 [Dichotomocladium elegans]|nr:hypothetical protein BX666DRAFT_2009923 [Dichotomocladium elegans]
MNYDVTFIHVHLLIITFLIPIVVATSSDDQAIVNKIRADESHLRALVVILSLAGGLALSFGLGAGICLYWHLRKFRRKKHLRKPPHTSSAAIETAVIRTPPTGPVIIPASSSVCDMGSASSPIGRQRQPTFDFTHVPPSSAAAAEPLPQVLVPPMVDTRINNEGAPQPGPSAPSAKEVLQQQDELAAATEASQSSHPHYHRLQAHCCYHPPTPPPAYTPRTLNHLMNDPDIAPAVLFAIGRIG